MNSASIPPPVLSYHRGVHWFAVFLTVWTFLVVTMGGTVKSHESGLSIPEPFIYTLIKGWNHGNRIYEFLHRAMVGVLGGGVVVLVAWLHLVETRRSVKRFSLLLIVSVVAQAVIGALTVNLMAHAPTSIPHAALGQSLLAMLAGLATVLSPMWMSPAPPVAEKESPSLHKLSLWLLIAVFVQLLLGAALRHDDHGKALQHGREGVFFAHVGAHVVGALAVGYFMSRVLGRVVREHRDKMMLRAPAMMIMMLYTLQLILGTVAAILKYLYSADSFYTVYNGDHPPPVRVWTATAHVVVGALIMALSALLTVRARRYVQPCAVSKDASGRPVMSAEVTA